VAFSRDGKLLASAHDPGQMYIWDAATGKEKLRWKTTRPPMFHTLAFSPDGNTLVSSGRDSSGVQWWDVATGKEIARPQVGHGGWLKALGFSRDGKNLFSLSGVGEFLSWSTDGKNHVRSQLPICAGAAFAPDGKTTLSVDWDGKIGGGFSVRLRDSATGKEIRSLGKVPLANQVAFSPDGKSLALAEAGGGTLTVSVWDLVSGKPRHRFARPGNRLYFCLAFSPDGKKVAAGSWADRPNFHLWDLDTGKEIPSCDPDHWVNSIAFSPDGSLVALGSGGDHKNCLSVWNLATATQFHRFALAGSEVVSAFSPSGRFVVTGASLKSMARGPKAEESAVRVWEVATGKEVASFQGHQSSITAVAFAPDGKSLASGGGDSTILIWDLVGQLRHGQRRQPLTAAELQTRWQDLAGGDAALAYKAIGELVMEGDAAVASLKTRLSPVPPPDAALARRATQLVEELNADAFDVRQKAALELEKIGEAAVPALRKALASRPSLDVRRRVEQILAGFEGKEAPLHLRKSRALEALELIATPAARELLRSLAQGEATARLTQEARAARQRLGQ
jgi:WD40 repeat protein